MIYNDMVVGVHAGTANGNCPNWGSRVSELTRYLGTNAAGNCGGPVPVAVENWGRIKTIYK